MASDAAAWVELDARHRWLHTLRGTVMDDRIAEMGLPAWGVYCVLRAYAHMQTGVAWPNPATIARHTGLAPAAVAQAIERLIALGVVRREVAARRNAYRLIEGVAVRPRKKPEGHNSFGLFPPEPPIGATDTGSLRTLEPLHTHKPRGSLTA